MSYLTTFTKGIIKENPVLVMLLGMCPSLAMTSSVKNAVGMGIAATFVLLGSNVVISLLKNVIPKQVRLPSFIVIIAGFVTIIGFIMQRFLPDLYAAMGVFLSLIVVNCIILARAEAFASQNNVAASALDALGMGLGFTLALTAISTVREILGAGTWLGLPITKNLIEPMAFFVTPAGGFFVFGIMVAAVNLLTKGKLGRKKLGCDGCKGGCAGCRAVEQGDTEGDDLK